MGLIAERAATVVQITGETATTHPIENFRLPLYRDVVLTEALATAIAEGELAHSKRSAVAPTAIDNYGCLPTLCRTSLPMASNLGWRQSRSMLPAMSPGAPHRHPISRPARSGRVFPPRSPCNADPWAMSAPHHGTRASRTRSPRRAPYVIIRMTKARAAVHGAEWPAECSLQPCCGLKLRCDSICRSLPAELPRLDEAQGHATNSSLRAEVPLRAPALCDPLLSWRAGSA
jgi:hypothetical protein